jgi:hypothetical protein
MNESKSKNTDEIGGRLTWRKRALHSSVTLRRDRNLLRSALCVSMALIAITASSRLAAGQSVTFGSAVSYSTDPGPRALVAGDFNSDGKPDIAVASSSINYVSILVGKGDGTFQKANHYQVSASPTAIIAGDFNHDGKLDVVTANTNANNISVLFGNGDGTFQSAVNYAVERGPVALVAGDFNSDGDADIAVAIPSSGSVSILLGNADGTFQKPVSYNVPLYVSTLAIGDFNNDGKIDLVTADSTTVIGGGNVGVLLGNGNGTFQPVIKSPCGSLPYTVAAGDFNRDGKLDVAVGTQAPPSLKILFGNGDGSFKPPTISFRPGNTPTDIKAGDFNGDGKLDLVSAGVFKGSNVQIFLGKGDGNFSDAGKLMDGVAALSLSVTDFNGDTRPDIAVVVNGEVNVVLVNATPGKPDDTSYFVHQHYLDFLSREPDDRGFDYWTNEIDRCANDPVCLRNKRVDISAAFFIETEFQQSGYFIYRLYKAALGRRPTYAEFALDRPKIETGSGMDASQSALVAAFVARDQFKQLYPDTLSNAEFVNKLFDSAGLPASSTDRQTAVASLNAGASRASVLQSLIRNAAFAQQEYNAAFVQMQYFGYLRRDEDTRGYQFWLDVLNNKVQGNFRAMVCAFLTSAEYQQRLGAAVTRTDAECAR